MNTTTPSTYLASALSLPLLEEKEFNKGLKEIGKIAKILKYHKGQEFSAFLKGEFKGFQDVISVRNSPMRRNTCLEIGFNRTMKCLNSKKIKSLWNLAGILIIFILFDQI